MFSRYTKRLFLLLAPAALLLPALLYGQNTPQISQNSVPGSTTLVTAPPALSATAVPSYVRVYSPKVPMVSEPYLNTVTPEEVQVATAYKDGFNRTILSVAHHATTSGSTTLNLLAPADTRFRRDQLSFQGYSSASADYNPGMFAAQSAYYLSLYPGENYTAASRAEVVSTALVRGVKTLAPGKSQIGQNRGITTIKTRNEAGQVRIWELDGSGMPFSNSYYGADQLFGEHSSDTSGAETLTYTDKDGKLILKTIKQATVVAGQTVTPVYGSTLYIYDDYGRLRYTFPPLAFNAAIGGTITATQLDQLCFQYQYDSKGRLSAERKPGEGGFTYFVYDQKDRLVMRQSPNEVAEGRWEVTYYDNQNRIKATSLYTNSSDRAYWQNLLDGSSPGSTAAELSWHLMTAAGEAGYPAENAVSGNTVMSYTYYDDYSRADVGGSKWNSFDNNNMLGSILSTDGAEIPVRSNRTHGMLTGSKVRILPAAGVSTAQTGQWTEQSLFYDDKGRGIYTVSWDMDGATFVHEHYTGVQYDFMGRALISKHVMKNNAVYPADGHTEYSRNFYHAKTGQLLKTMHKNDSLIWTVSSMYTYDDLGRVKRKVLGNYGEVQDLDYNIRGQLSGINETYALTGNKGGESRSFGEALRYDYGFDQPRYDGKVSGMIWRGSVATTMYAYGYSYDYGGRLKSADFRKNSAGSWNNTDMDYSVSNLGYDGNGNIQSMNQKGSGSSSPTTIDQLSYTYTGNQLMKVDDAISANYGNGDFQNGVNTNDDYSYDANGNLTLDRNKGLSSATWTHFNKPQVLTMGGGKSITNSYDASGTKVQEKIVDSSGNKTTSYVGNYVYEGNDLLYLLTPEGRNVYDKTNHTFKEEYFVKDHLGNIRSVVDVHNYPVMQYLATYEIASANLENLFFDNVDEVRDENPGATFDGNLMSARLNGEDPDRRTGTSLLLKVMAGDKVEMNVNNYCESYDPNQDNPVSWEDMMNSVLSTLTTGGGGSVEGELHGTKRITDAFEWANFNTFEDMVGLATDPSKPKAYLNYVLFDENMHIVPAGSGTFQANGNGTWTQMGTIVPMEIPENGYLAVYINNRTQLGCGACSDVFFDQLSVRFTKGSLKEESHYYPHGLPIKNMGSAASGFTANRHRYQGNEYVQETGLNWMDFQNRQYDPQIGRFMQVDPLADETDVIGPYVAMDNDPVLNVDPMGLQGVNYMARPEQEANARSVADYYNSITYALEHPMGDPLMEARRSWGSGASAAFKEDVKEGKSKSMYEMLSEAAVNPGSIVTNFGLEEMESIFLGYDEYGNKLYYNAYTEAIAAYSGTENQDPVEARLVAVVELITGPDGFKINKDAVEFSTRSDGSINWAAYAGYSWQQIKANDMMAGNGSLAYYRGTSVATSVEKTALVQSNRAAGNLFRDELAAGLRAEGREVATEVYKKTPFGARYIDIEVSQGGSVMGGIETKVGNSRYHSSQRLKDLWLNKVEGYPVDLVRKP